MNWPVLFAVLLSWIVVYAVLAKGITISGKISIFTVLAPYFMLGVLFFRTIGLEGSSAGLAYLFTPNFSELFKIKTWYYAIDQNFFQHAIGSAVVFLLSTFRNRKDRST